MRKLILTVLAGAFSAGMFAQNATAEKNKALSNLLSTPVSNQTMFYSPVPVDNGTPLNTESFPNNMMRAGGTTVGNTTYGLGSNGAPSDRLFVYETGEISVVYTGSEETGGSYTDRGTYYNHNDGGAWGPISDLRIETYRTGFPQMTNLGGIAGLEYFVAHNGTNQLALFSSPAGTGTWTELPTSLSLTGTWPRIAGSGTYLHMLSADYPATGDPALLLYHRSSDGGLTWDIMNSYLPTIDDPSLYAVMGAESYKIEAEGSNVWVVAGESVNDLAMWKSTDNGDTWTKTRIIEWPMPGYDDVISDITGDGVADTITTQDGLVAFTIDNSGMAHVFAGATRVIDETVGDGGWSYFPGVTGMWYWNETFGPDSIQYLDILTDWDGDGDYFLGIGASLPNYGCGFTSQPTVSLDPTTGNIYLAYTQAVEYTDWLGDPADETAQSFRDIFGIYTEDGGVSWSTPVNITYVAEEHFENVYPTSTLTTVGGTFDVLWMQDQEPGNEFEGTGADAVGNNDIIYRAYDLSRFDPYPPTADYSYIAADELLTFTNLSVDASTYSWSFGDGGSATTKNTSHVYAASGLYNVCLTATNVYDDDQECKTIDVIVSSVQNIALQEAINIYPSPASSFVNVEVEGQFGELQLSIYNNIGEIVLNTVTMNSNNIQIDVQNLASGNYIIKMMDAAGKFASAQFTVSK